MTSAIQKPWIVFLTIVFLTVTSFGLTLTSPVSADNHIPSESILTNNSIPEDCSDSLDPSDCDLMRYIVLITDGLSVLVGIVVVMMLVIGGIRYASAGSNPQAVTSAKKHISNALFALVLYLFMFAFLQWIIPGGIL